MDLLASFAALTGQKLAAGDGARQHRHPLGACSEAPPRDRTELVEEAGALSLRSGPWKYIEPNKKQKINADTNTELGNDSVPQLYNLSTDPGETKNLADDQPARVQAMAARLDAIRKADERR